MKTLRCLLLTAFTLLFLNPAAAAPLKPSEVPEPLRPWVGWVLTGHEDQVCPFAWQNPGDRRCHWPTALILDLESSGGSFEMDLRVERDGWAYLPGEIRHWPQGVGIDTQTAVITERDGRPAVWVPVGNHHFTGTFAWNQIPEALTVPADTGLLRLTVNGRTVPFPDLSAEGRLWLKARDTGGQDLGDTDRLDLQVYRRVTDEIPLLVETRLILDVAGKQREVVIAGALLPESIPLLLNSPLPARLEADGSLRLQVRPGHWEIGVTARHPGEVTELTATAAAAPWPEEEIWVFEARNHLRLVEVHGPLQIDPRQTNLPPDWQGFPAYRLTPGTVMQFKTIRRGDPQPEPDRLTLDRQLWLDFDGTGLTFSDRVGGTITAGWRLEMQPPMQLGRVAVEGQSQLITRAPGSTLDGVELRRGGVNLEADGRIDAATRSLPVTGWAHEMTQAGATLNLPPGWRLWHVRGVDNVRATGAWIYQWTLLDLFLVLIAAVAAGKLFGRHAGLLMLATLVLIWKEPEAPAAIWLHLLAAIALARVLPTGRFRALALLYRNLALIVLAVIALPFIVDQLRLGLFPQLARPWQSVEPAPAQTTVATAALAEPEIAMQAAPQAIDELATTEMPAAPPSPRELMRKDKGPLDGLLPEYDSSVSGVPGRSMNFNEIDPKANVQTGPGLPRWNWTQVPLAWNGPVTAGQTVELILTSPAQNLGINLLRVVLIALLAGAIVRLGIARSGIRPGGVAASIALVALVATGGLPSAAVAADYPPQEMLNELQTRLLAPPDCLPACADAPRLRLVADGGTLQVRIEIHAREHVAMPLPGTAAHWLPSALVVDGEPAAGLARTADGGLWLNLAPGAHQIQMEGPMPPSPSFELALPLPPRRVEVERLSGWSLAGLRDDGTAENLLLFTRDQPVATQPSVEAEVQPSTLPAFARVERTLSLGLNWRVETRVVRLSAPDAAIVIEVPLLAGESVVSEGLRVADGKVQINMPAQQAEFTYESTIEKAGEIVLTAPQTAAWVEVWRADISPILHLETTGIAVVHHQATGGSWLPEWRPWPGESVKLALTRPEGVEGRTYTIDSSKLSIAPGERATDTTLEIALRSSQGGQYTLTLPDGAELQTTTINGLAQPVRQEGRLVTLPLTPGLQQINLAWHEPRGLTPRFRSPDVDLAIPGVNAAIEMAMPEDRWILLTRGPNLGPAVMFWGTLAAIAIVAIGLGRVRLTPLTTAQWLLLGLGLSQLDSVEAVFVAGWLLALGLRARMRPDIGKFRFNCVQLALVVLTFLALGEIGRAHV